MARKRHSMNFFNTLRNSPERHRFGRCSLDGGGEHGLGQRKGTTTVMAAHQAAHPAVAPDVGPVVDALSGHTKLFGNHLGADPAPEHQQARGSRARVPMFVIDRQLLQRQLLGLAQFYNALHQLPRHHEDARIDRFKSIGQEHLEVQAPCHTSDPNVYFEGSDR